jgi:hypothetical protein
MAAVGIAKRVVTATPFVLAVALVLPVAPTLDWLIRICHRFGKDYFTPLAACTITAATAPGLET